jgi:hypothetical protein
VLVIGEGWLDEAAPVTKRPVAACALSKPSVLRRENGEPELQFGRGRGAARMTLFVLQIGGARWLSSGGGAWP